MSSGKPNLGLDSIRAPKYAIQDLRKQPLQGQDKVSMEFEHEPDLSSYHLFKDRVRRGIRPPSKFA